jgi:hypothetical protein
MIHAQDKNALSLNIGSPTTPHFVQWSLGLGYERILNEHFSFQLTGDIAMNNVTVADTNYAEDKHLEVDILAHLRYYPFNSALNKLFIDVGAGYTFLSLSSTKTATSNFFALQSMIGWKFIINRIFIQPWIGYNISFGEINYPEYWIDASNSYRGKNGFVNFGISAGIIF